MLFIRLGLRLTLEFFFPVFGVCTICSVHTEDTNRFTVCETSSVEFLIITGKQFNLELTTHSTW